MASTGGAGPAPGLKYLGDQEASLGQELVGCRVGKAGRWGKASGDPHLCFRFPGAPSARCLYSSDAVVKSHVDTNDKNNIQNAKYLLNVWSTLVIRILHPNYCVLCNVCA